MEVTSLEVDALCGQCGVPKQRTQCTLTQLLPTFQFGGCDHAHWLGWLARGTGVTFCLFWPEVESIQEGVHLVSDDRQLISYRLNLASIQDGQWFTTMDCGE